MTTFCECGCGEPVAKKGNRFIHGHNGCGVNNGMYGKHHTDEAKAKMAENHFDVSDKHHPMYGKHHTDEAKAKMAENHFDVSDKHHPMYGKHHTDEAKAKMAEKMSGKNNKMYGIRGGNDIVNHHYIYDHSDLSKYTMKVTRSKHAKIHAWMKKAGIKVPQLM